MFIDMYANCGVIHVESLLAEVERNLSISDSADRRGVWQLEKNEIFTVKSAWALIDDIWHPTSNNFGTLSKYSSS
jgi:hypothetical protein